MEYPYLARNYVNGKAYVVLFIEEETGVVVMTEITNNNIYLGKYGKYDEEAFEILPPSECVRLNN